MGIPDSTRYIHTNNRSGFTQASGLNDQVFKGHIIRIRIRIRFGYFTVDYNISPIFQIMDTRNIKNIVFRQDDILRSTIHDGFNVNRNNFSSKVLTLTIKDSTVQESITRQALGFVHQFADGIQFTV